MEVGMAVCWNLNSAFLTLLVFFSFVFYLKYLTIYVGQCGAWISASLGRKRQQMYFLSTLQSTGPKHLCLPFPLPFPLCQNLGELFWLLLLWLMRWLGRGEWDAFGVSWGLIWWEMRSSGLAFL